MGGGGVITSSRFTSHETNIYVFTLLVQRSYKVSKTLRVPFCKTELLRLYFSKLTRVLQTCAAINTLGKPAVGGSVRTEM